MVKKLEPPKPITWKVYKIANKLVWLGDVEAPDEAAAMEKAAVEFKVPANRLMVTTLPRYRPPTRFVHPRRTLPQARLRHGREADLMRAVAGWPIGAS